MKNKTVVKEEEKNHAKEQALAQLKSIIEMVDYCEEKEKNGTDDEREDAQQRILDDPLAIATRSGWHIPGTKEADEEFEIILCTGGPAVRLIGTLDKYAQPETVSIEYQDWFTPWTKLPIEVEENDKLLMYCNQFYFGE